MLMVPSIEITGILLYQLELRFRLTKAMTDILSTMGVLNTAESHSATTSSLCHKHFKIHVGDKIEAMKNELPVV